MRSNYLLAGVFLLGGCMSAKHFESPFYVPSSQAYGKLLPLRVAIAYPEEGIGAPNRDFARLAVEVGHKILLSAMQIDRSRMALG